jgi:hypothetical protein
MKARSPRGTRPLFGPASGGCPLLDLRSDGPLELLLRTSMFGVLFDDSEEQ